MNMSGNLPVAMRKAELKRSCALSKHIHSHAFRSTVQDLTRILQLGFSSPREKLRTGNLRGKIRFEISIRRGTENIPGLNQRMMKESILVLVLLDDR